VLKPTASAIFHLPAHRTENVGVDGPRRHRCARLRSSQIFKPEKLAAVALANKTARIAWKLMISGERYCTKYAEA
jgi:hypothetical protein